MLSNKRILLLSIVIGLVWYLKPLISHEEIMALGPGDTFAHAALTTRYCKSFGSSSTYTTDFFYPVGVNLTYDSPVLHLSVCPLISLGPVAMFNAMAAFQVILIIFTSYLFAHSLYKSTLIQASFILLYGFSGFYLARSQQHIYLLSTIWAVPAAVLLFRKLQLTNTKSVIFFFIGTAVILLTTWQNAPNLFALYLVFGLIALKRIERQNKNISLQNILLGLVGFVVIIIPFIKPMWQNFVKKPQPASDQSIFVYNADFLTYAIPHPAHPLYSLMNEVNNHIINSRRVTGELIQPVDPLIICILLYALWKQRHQLLKLINKPLVIISCITFVLSLGPYLSLAGSKIVSLPFNSLIYSLPPYSLTRTPVRLGIIILFTTTLYGLKYIDKSINSQSGKIILLIYAIFVSLIIPGNLTIPHFNYRSELPRLGLSTIATDPNSVAILHFPTAIEADPTQNFLQLYHGHPLLTGYISYASVTPQTYSHIATDPFFSRLGCSRHQFPYSKDAADILSQPGLVYDHLTGSNVGYIIVNKMILGEDHCQDLQIYYYNEVKNYPFLKTLEQSTVFDIYRIE